MPVDGIEVVHWNPRKIKVPGLPVRVGSRKDNFGDLLGPMVVRRLLERLQAGLSSARRDAEPSNDSQGTGQNARRLLSVGSILHFAKDGDVIWGTGVNGKINDSEHRFKELDIRAVRGPRTAEWIKDKKGLDVPEVFGDPGLLVAELFPELQPGKKERRLTVIPNLNELSRFRHHPDLISPTAPVQEVLRSIAASEMVVGSSLHAIVVADSFGIPSALVKSEAEPGFKYEDYFAGSNQSGREIFSDVDSAVGAATSLLRSNDYIPLANWTSQSVVASFPRELWGINRQVHTSERMNERDI